MTASELKKKFIDFLVSKGHKQIINYPLVPENDPSALFVSAGMHPLVPYLLGEPHPAGKRLCNVQRCLRTDDIEHVGDGFHHTFFEMMGNWSLGAYWKKEAIEYSWEFYTKILGIEPQKMAVSCFEGNDDVPKDEESAKTWLSLGVPKEKIFFLGKKENWWGPVGQTGPCGPDSEFFYDTGKSKCGSKCDVSCQCGKYLELGNNVFMEYNRLANGKYELLKQRNVDFGGGVERAAAVINGFKDDNYRTDLFWPIIKEIKKLSGKQYKSENQKAMRIIADHFKAAAFLIADGVVPSNKDQGYVLRRLIRRAVFKMYQLPVDGSRKEASKEICQKVIDIYSADYPNLKITPENIIILTEEIDKFEGTFHRGVKFLEKNSQLDGKIIFDAYQSYGIPFEVIKEMAKQKGQEINQEDFEREFKKHQETSKKGASKKFSGGLADHSAIVTKYHTATHLLHQALREVLGDHVRQTGCNITAERLRFDFSHPQALTDKQTQKVEKIINQKIKENLAVKMEVMAIDQAKNQGALAFFGERYNEKVKVFSAGNYSKEVCAGPHVTSTGEIGKIKIIKQKAVGAGRRRLYAILAHGS